MKSGIFTKFFILLFLALSGFSFCKKDHVALTNHAQADEGKEDSSRRFNLSGKLVTPNPTYEAKALYQFLLKNYGKKIISGVMTLNSFDETTWLKQNTGKKTEIV